MALPPLASATMSLILDTIPGLVFLPWRILTSSVDAALALAVATSGAAANVLLIVLLGLLSSERAEPQYAAERRARNAPQLGDNALPLVGFVLKGYGLAIMLARIHGWAGTPTAAYCGSALLGFARNDSGLRVLTGAPALEALDFAFLGFVLPAACAPSLVLHGSGAAAFLWLCLAFMWRQRGEHINIWAGGFAVLAVYSIAWAVGAFAPLLALDPADGVLILVGVAIFRACPWEVAAGLLPISVLLAPGSQVPAQLSAAAGALGTAAVDFSVSRLGEVVYGSLAATASATASIAAWTASAAAWTATTLAAVVAWSFALAWRMLEAGAALGVAGYNLTTGTSDAVAAAASGMADAASDVAAAARPVALKAAAAGAEMAVAAAEAVATAARAANAKIVDAFGNEDEFDRDWPVGSAERDWTEL